MCVLYVCVHCVFCMYQSAEGGFGYAPGLEADGL